MALRHRAGMSASGVDTDSGVTNIELYRRMLREEIDIAELAKLTDAQKRARLERVMGTLLSREGPLLSPRERLAVIRRVVDESLGLGVLEPLLGDPSITEVMVNGPDDIYVERDGRIEKVPVSFGGMEQLYQTIDRIVSGVNRRIDESSPMVDARLPTGERVNVVIPPLALDGPSITIRRFPHPFTMTELAGRGSVDLPTLHLLRAMVLARFNVVVSGGTGSGKTTMLNALSGFIPDHERIVTIEDAAELQLQQPHVVRLEARPPNVEGRGTVSIRDLVRNSLRMRPDRIVVGEVRGGETLDMLQAMNTGHEGSLCTVHANSAADAILRLETLASMSELPIPFSALRDQINSAVDVIVQLDRGTDGRRRVVEVVVVTSRRQEDYLLTPVMHFEARPTEGGEVRGEIAHLRLPDRLARRLALAAVAAPPEFGAGAPVAGSTSAVDR